jgi:hypothetical protein
MRATQEWNLSMGGGSMAEVQSYSKSVGKIVPLTSLIPALDMQSGLVWSKEPNRIGSFPISCLITEVDADSETSYYFNFN